MLVTALPPASAFCMVFWSLPGTEFYCSKSLRVDSVTAGIDMLAVLPLPAAHQAKEIAHRLQ